MDMVDTVGAGCGMRYAYGMSTGSCTSQMYARVVGCSAYCPTVVATVARQPDAVVIVIAPVMHSSTPVQVHIYWIYRPLGHSRHAVAVTWC